MKLDDLPKIDDFDEKLKLFRTKVVCCYLGKILRVPSCDERGEGVVRNLISESPHADILFLNGDPQSRHIYFV